MYLFDNVLADLNSEVASEIIQRVFKGVLKDKTVILSTSDPSKYSSIMNADLKIEEKNENNVLVV
jgi:hypothetical protein